MIKFSLFLLGQFALIALMTEKSIGSQERRGYVDGIQRILQTCNQRILQSILKKPEYLSLDYMKQQKILIAFFHILQNPRKYSDVIKTIAWKL